MRTLAAELGLAVNTVARSYRDLELQGLVVTRGRHGTSIASETPVARRQALEEVAEFVRRMRELGISDAELFAVLRREVARTGGEADSARVGVPSPDDPDPDVPPA